jgi:polyribonucleotide nucleotidyltransferase
MTENISIEIGGRVLSIETGRIANQADGSVLVRYGESVVLVTAVSSSDINEDADFLPLIVDYQEKSYAAGKIPGGFYKREGKPTDNEILTSRLIDRSIRPLFPEGYLNETQIIAAVLSVDQENSPDVLAIIGASAALVISDIPFSNALYGVRVGKIDGNYIINPTYQQLLESDIDLVIAGNKDGIIMVEGGARIVPEDDIIKGIIFGHESMKEVIRIQEELRERVGKVKRSIDYLNEDNSILKNKIRDLWGEEIRKAINIPQKLDRRNRLNLIMREAIGKLAEEYEEEETKIISAFEEFERDILRESIIKYNVRIDGRGLKDIRPLDIEVGVLPRPHGSALFRRGETQTLAVTTLGTSADEQKIDSLEGESFKTFMLHYNFPPFSVGEVKFLRAPGRREIGHGALAERAFLSLLPSPEEFPYTIRVVSDVMESNGSSSMATVCSASLSLMDAGVPIKGAVAGIAMGLIKEGENFFILSDILGDEDHLGDMDFKVAGTKDGITSLQMDIKIPGITEDIMKEALYQAREGRLFILRKMDEVLSEPRPDISEYAPRIVSMMVKPEKIRDIIGPSGKNIKWIIEKTGVKIDIDDSIGKVKIFSSDSEASERAVKMIKDIVQEAELGGIYLGKVKRIMDFGAFVEIFQGTEGLLHISEISHKRIRKVSDVLKEGDEVLVKVIGIDKDGRVKLSRKEVLGDEKAYDNIKK